MIGARGISRIRSITDFTTPEVMPVSMTKSTHIADNIPAAPQQINYYKFLPSVSTTRGIIMLHGDGEDGPANGDDLELVLKLGIGKNLIGTYPTIPADGVLTEMVINANVLIPQMHANSWGSSSWGQHILNHVIDDLGWTDIWLTGLSQGGIGCMQWVQDKSNNDGKIRFVMPVGGWLTAAAHDTYSRVPGIAYHGTDDTTVGYGTARPRYTGYQTEWGIPGIDTGINNAMGQDIYEGGRPIVLNPFDQRWIHFEKGHSIWNDVYDPDTNAHASGDYSQFEVDYAREMRLDLVPQP